MKIAFDVDGTLITLSNDRPRWDVIDMLRTLKKCGHTITVWSGGGKDYADMWVRRLFLEDAVDEICGKPLIAPLVDGKERVHFCDIAFDDEQVLLGKINVRV